MTILRSLALAAGSAVMAFGMLPEQKHISAATEPVLELDGVFCGYLLTSDLTQTPGKASEVVTFHPTAMSSAFYTTWLSAFLNGQRFPRNLQVLQVGPGGKVQSAAAFLSVLPQQVDLPALDATSKESLKWTVRFSAPTVGLTTPTNKVQGPISRRSPALADNFRVAIDGIDTSRVFKVEAMTIKPPTSGGVGPERQTNVAVSNLVLYISVGFEQPFRLWMANSPTQVKSGSLTFLKPNLQAPWGTLALHGLVIKKVETVSTAASGSIPKARVEMTVGSIQFTPSL